MAGSCCCRVDPGAARDVGVRDLTTAANATLAPLHDRMPALLSPRAADAWLARGDAGLLAPAPDSRLAAREVSPLVNAVANDGPELLERAPPPRQLTLL